MTGAPALGRVSYLVAGGFPGGTSSAVAAELAAVRPIVRPRLALIDVDMFPQGRVAPQLEEAIAREKLAWVANPPVVQDDVVVLHNPSCLKRNMTFETQIICRHLIVVTHENFERPGGAAPYDVDATMSLIDGASTATRKSLAPISQFNRAGVERWHAATPGFAHWDVLEADWVNIFEPEMLPPTNTPRDRRGRISRSGPEKFPPLDALDLVFPPEAEANVILGADSLLPLAQSRPHWALHPFGTRAVEDVLSEIDFFVYFTSSAWRESFGRVLAEGIAAGKVVISDPDTAENFDGAVIGARPEEVSAIISRYIADPAAYGRQVETAQAGLQAFSPAAFRQRFEGLLAPQRVAA